LDKFTKEELKDFIIGVCVIVAALMAVGIYKWQSKVWADAEDSDYAVYATFNRTDGLEVGSRVRMAGIDVGYVDNSVLDENFRATLTLMIKSGVQIPDDSGASIVSSGVMGAKYIEIEAGGSEEFIAEGDEFEYTQDAMVLEELVDRIISMGKANRKKQIVEVGKKCEDAAEPKEDTMQTEEE
jgi:phospholipid/cholesterol/gamma-HCH transport system substrate-binding protein